MALTGPPWNSTIPLSPPAGTHLGLKHCTQGCSVTQMLFHRWIDLLLVKDFKFQVFETDHLNLVNLKMILPPSPTPREIFFPKSVSKLMIFCSQNALLSTILTVTKVSS